MQLEDNKFKDVKDEFLRAFNRTTFMFNMGQGLSTKQFADMVEDYVKDFEVRDKRLIGVMSHLINTMPYPTLRGILNDMVEFDEDKDQMVLDLSIPQPEIAYLEDLEEEDQEDTRVLN